jgi:hypothetical protein
MEEFRRGDRLGGADAEQRLAGAEGGKGDQRDREGIGDGRRERRGKQVAGDQVGKRQRQDDVKTEQRGKAEKVPAATPAATAWGEAERRRILLAR